MKGNDISSDPSCY